MTEGEEIMCECDDPDANWQMEEELSEYRIKSELLEAENERLRKGIQDYLDGNYDHPRAHRHEPAKGCKHARFYYEDCSECDSAYFSALLGETVGTETNLAVFPNA
jgi:hypothetical protein